MNEKKQVALDKLQKEISSTTQRIMEQIQVVESLPDELPGEISSNEFGTWIYLPYDMAIVRRTRQLLAPTWKPANSKYASINQQAGILNMDLINDKLHLYIAASAQRQGSLCRLEKIGTKMIEQPIFKIVCESKETEKEKQ